MQHKPQKSATGKKRSRALAKVIKTKGSIKSDNEESKEEYYNISAKRQDKAREKMQSKKMIKVSKLD